MPTKVAWVRHWQVELPGDLEGRHFREARVTGDVAGELQAVHAA